MGPFSFFCFPALFVFCWGLRPVLGRVSSPPRKSGTRPSLRGVCARSDRCTLSPPFPILSRGTRRLVADLV